jgi:anti-sigma regulatory factor (Ser/Thr protein kinase)
MSIGTSTGTLLLRNDLSEITRLSQFIQHFCESHGFPADIVFNITLSLEELVVNTISYGYGEGGEHEFPVRLWVEDDSVCIQLEDSAAPFNPLDTPEFDVHRAMQQERIGGLGITLVKRLMDEFTYERTGDGRNVIRLRKRLSPASATS